MDTETRAALADLTEMVRTGFARNDRYFELMQAQHLELRDEVRGDIAEVRGDIAELRREMVELRATVDGLADRVATLEQEFRAFRDWATRELADVRRELREVRALLETGYTELRRDVNDLSARVARLESQIGD
jgi:chromosome segregation ATPase